MTKKELERENERLATEVSFLHNTAHAVSLEHQDRIADLTAQLAAMTMERESAKARADSQLEAAMTAEKRDCDKALLTLAGAHYPTPLEGYGTNSSWAISDMCRAVRSLHAQLAERDKAIAEAREAIGNAPHGGTCHSVSCPVCCGPSDPEYCGKQGSPCCSGPCDCWKSRALAALGQL